MTPDDRQRMCAAVTEAGLDSAGLDEEDLELLWAAKYRTAARLRAATRENLVQAHLAPGVVDAIRQALGADAGTSNTDAGLPACKLQLRQDLQNQDLFFFEPMDTVSTAAATSAGVNSMFFLDPEGRQIAELKKWLDRAEDEYCMGRPIRPLSINGLVKSGKSYMLNEVLPAVANTYYSSSGSGRQHAGMVLSEPNFLRVNCLGCDRSSGVSGFLKEFLAVLKWSAADQRLSAAASTPAPSDNSAVAAAGAIQDFMERLPRDRLNFLLIDELNTGLGRSAAHAVVNQHKVSLTVLCDHMGEDEGQWPVKHAQAELHTRGQKALRGDRCKIQLYDISILHKGQSIFKELLLDSPHWVAWAVTGSSMATLWANIAVTLSCLHVSLRRDSVSSQNISSASQLKLFCSQFKMFQQHLHVLSFIAPGSPLCYPSALHVPLPLLLLPGQTNDFVLITYHSQLNLSPTVSKGVLQVAWEQLKAQAASWDPPLPSDLVWQSPQQIAMLAYLCQEWSNDGTAITAAKLVEQTLRGKFIPEVLADMHMVLQVLGQPTSQVLLLRKLLDPMAGVEHAKLPLAFEVLLANFTTERNGRLYLDNPLFAQVLQAATTESGELLDSITSIPSLSSTMFRELVVLGERCKDKDFDSYEDLHSLLEAMASALALTPDRLLKADWFIQVRDHHCNSRGSKTKFERDDRAQTDVKVGLRWFHRLLRNILCHGPILEQQKFLDAYPPEMAAFHSSGRISMVLTKTYEAWGVGPGRAAGSHTCTAPACEALTLCTICSNRAAATLASTALQFFGRGPSMKHPESLGVCLVFVSLGDMNT
ncbi:hypothetical protein VOLCADRAFT_106538 [Volvox carteri f. nagariensis]|uniref:Uncharacterized protein n=1 Tax=Volvox carteri f. nagariensis TaxID=3068 RepID=D8U7W9_VOLCA|nr:uncharacterized protein VOLCADRAFT_106538 [Volvox carteri f. nagariensis]EFJ44219.1 hypothetical protein VOLCADRAFT_106538 [Volvox carteri f. nagariensis]|eukprot:XP_002954813.1 hypothetical protein VOLCADRAFT_106538 [Volvox carteri f. nagariensis]